MLRVVFDPGVLVSAVVSKTGPPAQALDLWRDGEFDIIVSPSLLNELERVLLRPKFRPAAPEDEVRAYVDALAREAVLVLDPEQVPAVTVDPGDDYLVALAVAVGADAIVSGDRDLTELANPPIPILTPRELLERLERTDFGKDVPRRGRAARGSPFRGTRRRLSTARTLKASDANIRCMAVKRTTVGADRDDLALLESEARRRNVSLAQLLRELVEREADTLRSARKPRFGVARSEHGAAAAAARDEDAPLREHAGT